jgi:hypothetical protein
VAAGIGQWLHYGWSRSRPAGHRCRRGAGPSYSRTKAIVTIWTLAGKVRCLQKGATAMKKRNVVIRYFVLLMLMVAFVACASTRTQESTGEYVDDSVITTKVKSLLAADDFLKSFEIGVETFKGTVQLSGFVDSQKAIDKAVEITRSVKGVKSVKNNLNVKK